MQVVQRDQAEPENFFRLDQVTDVTARKFPAGLARAVFFYRVLVQRELCVFCTQSNISIPRAIISSSCGGVPSPIA